MFGLIVQHSIKPISHNEEVEESDMSEEIHREIILAGRSLSVKHAIKEIFSFGVTIQLLISGKKLKPHQHG